MCVCGGGKIRKEREEKERQERMEREREVRKRERQERERQGEEEAGGADSAPKTGFFATRKLVQGTTGGQNH